MSCVHLYANQTKNGGRRLPDVKHECYGKLSVKSFPLTINYLCNVNISCSERAVLCDGGADSICSYFQIWNRAINLLVKNHWKWVPSSDLVSLFSFQLSDHQCRFSTTPCLWLRWVIYGIVENQIWICIYWDIWLLDISLHFSLFRRCITFQ